MSCAQRIKLWLVMVLFSFSISKSVQAYEVLGQAWDPTTVDYWVNLNLTNAGTTEEQILAAQEAADTWTNDGYANFSYNYLGTNSDTSYSTMNSTNTIMSVSGGAPFYSGLFYGCAMYSSSSYVLGFNSYWSNATTGEILDSYIVICQDVYNSSTGASLTIDWSSSGVDLQSVIAHELGHMLGLNHSCDFLSGNSIPDCSTSCGSGSANSETMATMCATVTSGQTHARDINLDDIHGLQAIYGTYDGDGDTYIGSDGDCDDTNSSIHPDATEVCDGVDNDCDDSSDEGFDSDGDGTADCFDTETCDGVDNDGDSQIDEGFDADGDSMATCMGDCDDADATIYLGATEVIDDGIDQNCDDSDLTSLQVDNDGDGYAESASDCDDTNSAIHPAAQEILEDGIDQNCNGADATALTNDADNDGVVDALDTFPADASENADTDADGVGDNADTDDDGDGINDNAETDVDDAIDEPEELDDLPMANGDEEVVDAGQVPGAIDEDLDEVLDDADELDDNEEAMATENGAEESTSGASGAGGCALNAGSESFSWASLLLFWPALIFYRVRRMCC